MKITYKGFDIEAKRERSMGGETLLYYFIFRQSDGFEVTSGFSYGTDKICDFISYLKDIADDFLEDPQAYLPKPTYEEPENYEDSYEDHINEEKESK